MVVQHIEALPANLPWAVERARAYEACDDDTDRIGTSRHMNSMDHVGVDLSYVGKPVPEHDAVIVTMVKNITGS